MSERNGTVSPSDPGTMPIVLGEGATASSTTPAAGDAAVALPAPSPEPEPASASPPGAQPTAPVTVRPKPRLPRRGPLTVMGPWAPVAGGLLGLLLGGIAVAVLAGTAESFEDSLA